MPTRRDIIHTGALLVTGLALAEDATRPSFAGTTEDLTRVPGLAARLTFPDGTSRVFAAAHGVDLGDFKVPFANIVQRNIVAKSEDKLFSVFFRPDRNTDRQEVVVLYGDAFNDAPATMGAYTCEIFKDGRTLARIDVPEHFWLARWRWQSALRPRVRKPADLVAAKLSVAYKETNLATRMPRAAPNYTTMGHSNVTLFIGETGERDDIGQNPESTSAYMATGDEDAYESMMNWAEVSASGPWHINDPKTGGIINWDDWTTFTTFQDGPNNPRKLHIGPKPFPKKDCFRPDNAHHPCLSYIPFLLTGDPFHAEELQYQINLYLGDEHPIPDEERFDFGGPKGGKTYVFQTNQTRAWAWMLRSVVFAYLASDEIQSAMILPKAYWKKVLDHNLTWISAKFVHGTDARARIFSSGTSRNAMGWWQEDYLCGVLAMMMRLDKFDDWKPVFDWKIKSNVNRLNGTSGWPRTSPTIYYAQWWSLKFTPNAHNKGNGVPQQPVKFDEHTHPEGNFGDWTITFTDSNTFEITGPRGVEYEHRPGTVGKIYRNMAGPQFIINEGSVPFAPGDSFVMSMQPVQTWPELARVNGKDEPPDGDDLEKASHDYMGSLYAVMALAAPLDPTYKALYEWLKDSMGRSAYNFRVSWRNSFAST